MSMRYLKIGACSKSDWKLVGAAQKLLDGDKWFGQGGGGGEGGRTSREDDMHIVYSKSVRKMAGVVASVVVCSKTMWLMLVMMMRGSEGEGNCGPGSALDFWGKGPRFESGIYYKDPDALQDHCVIM